MLNLMPRSGVSSKDRWDMWENRGADFHVRSDGVYYKLQEERDVFGAAYGWQHVFTQRQLHLIEKLELVHTSKLKAFFLFPHDFFFLSYMGQITGIQQGFRIMQKLSTVQLRGQKLWKWYLTACPTQSLLSQVSRGATQPKFPDCFPQARLPRLLCITVKDSR